MVSTGTGTSFREGLGMVGVFARSVADTVWPWSEMGVPLLGTYCWVARVGRGLAGRSQVDEKALGGMS